MRNCIFQSELCDKMKLPVTGLHVIDATDKRSMVESYLLAATMKDCSVSKIIFFQNNLFVKIMISLQIRPPSENYDSNSIQVPSGERNYSYLGAIYSATFQWLRNPTRKCRSGQRKLRKTRK